MSDNIVPFEGKTLLDLPPDRVLEAAKGALEHVVIVGRDTNGELYLASNKSDGAETLWLLEIAKTELLAMGRRAPRGV